MVGSLFEREDSNNYCINCKKQILINFLPNYLSCMIIQCKHAYLTRCTVIKKYEYFANVCEFISTIAVGR